MDKKDLGIGKAGSYPNNFSQAFNQAQIGVRTLVLAVFLNIFE